MKWKLFTLSLFCTISLTAQDLHFSQFFNHAIYTSPGLVGVFDGDYRACGIYRSQWQSVPVDYRTFSAAFDMRLPVKILKEGYLSVGGILSADKAGDGEMQQIR
ncbi:MAG: type IX secretion system membrane protein PorP/SprF, partial [Bacteroidota bacterium]